MMWTNNYSLPSIGLALLATTALPLSVSGCALEEGGSEVGAKGPQFRGGETGESGGETGESGGGSETGAGAAWCQESAAPLELEHCDSNRELGFLIDEEAACVDVPGGKGSWLAEPLFQSPHPYLARFCKYAWSPNVAASPEPWQLDAVAEHEIDCEGVIGDGSSWSQAIDDELFAVFRDHIDHVADPDTAIPTPASRVDVIIVDNKVEGGFNTHSSHGAVMGALVEDIICDGAPGCVRELGFELAMPRYFNSDGESLHDPDGGSFGSVGDLARGLEDAYHRMLQSPAKRSVINFSGGWEYSPELTALGQLDLLGGQTLADFGPRSRAIHAVAVAIRCAGGLLVVAAGNRVPESCDLGPKYPGSWEQLPALTEAQCVEYGFAVHTKRSYLLPNHSGPGIYDPLLFSVGAVGYGGLPLANARIDAMPRLAAPGQYGVALEAGTYTDALAGSSVGTVVVSSLAALIWSYFPELPPADVMRLIYASAAPLEDAQGVPMISDYGLGGPVPVRQVGICSGLEMACSQHGLSCALSCDPGNPDLTTLELAVDGLLGGETLVTPVGIGDQEIALCVDGCSGKPATVVFPSGQAEPLSGGSSLQTYIPDPSDPSCASCELDFSGSSTSGLLILSLDEAYNPALLAGIWLRMEFADGSIENVYIGDATLPLSSTTTLSVTITLNGSQTPPASAAVWMMFDDINGRYLRSTAIPVVLGSA